MCIPPSIHSSLRIKLKKNEFISIFCIETERTNGIQTAHLIFLQVSYKFRNAASGIFSSLLWMYVMDPLGRWIVQHETNWMMRISHNQCGMLYAIPLPREYSFRWNWDQSTIIIIRTVTRENNRSSSSNRAVF